MERSGPIVTVIEPPRRWWRIDLAELWRFRELFLSLVRRDFQVRYKQTVLGVSWAFIRPIVTTIVFSVIFGKLGNLATDGLPKPLYYLAGIAVWRYFEQALSISSNSLLANQTLLTKIYVPRLILPTSAVIVSLVDLAIAFATLLALMLAYGVVPAWTVVYVPLFVFPAFAGALGCGMLLSALNVRYRDVRQLVPFLLQLWMYATIIVPYSQVAGYLGEWKWIYGLNPMAVTVEGVRWSLLHHRMEFQSFPTELLLPGIGMTGVLFVAGLYLFKRMERQFADII